jgi:DGQHR domain-containing protein
VHQWLPEWDEVVFSEEDHRRKPRPYFYLFTLPAPTLRALAGIARRTTAGRERGDIELGIQRRHEASRSEEIRDYVRYGFPWSSVAKARREKSDFSDLRKPGWLPTAIVVNILEEADTRGGRRVSRDDLIEVNDGGEGEVEIVIPSDATRKSWTAKALPPLEVIDGQHRLWAFDAGDPLKFELPVVAFYGLDISWQAYLFYTINIKPKRINTSLGFDLYPLLRTEDWLERFEGHAVYRETRAQELTEALWAYSESPWHNRIDMLGGGGRRQVSQAAWIRALLATFVKSWEGRGVRVGGLFGAPVGSDRLALPWTRAQQAAFLIRFWRLLRDAIRDGEYEWSADLRRIDTSSNGDVAFEGRYTLLNSDQGIRGVLSVVNDYFWVSADGLRLGEWRAGATSEVMSHEDITAAIRSLARTNAGKFQGNLAAAFARYDWRSSGTPSLADADRMLKARFRGAGGYVELRRDLLTHLRDESEELREIANIIWDWFDYDN